MYKNIKIAIFKKKLFFDFLSLFNQIHQLKSTIPKDFKPKKIFFLENEIFNLINKEVKHLQKNIDIYNFFIKNFNIAIIKEFVKKKKLVKRLIMLFKLEINNKIIYKLFDTIYKCIKIRSNF